MDEQHSVLQSQPSSFMTRATNVFTAPGELYSEVASAPAQSSSWLVPFLISIGLAIVFTFALYNNLSLRQQIYDMQTRTIQKSVDEGKMPQERADEMRERMENSGPVMFMLIGGGSAIFGIAVMFFGATLVLWLIAKFGLKSSGNYQKMLEVFGLASLVSILGSIITLIMMNLFDTMHASPGGGLLVMNSFDPANTGHKLLASLNIFTIWQASVLGIGVAKISGKSSGVGIGVTLGLWALWAVVSSLLGFGMR